ncbi:MAG: GNAT family N-acetyltransferase [Dehalococcoidia bacterium]
MTIDEVAEGEFITAYSFNSPERRDLAKAIERAQRFHEFGWNVAAYEDGEMTAFVRTIPFAIRLNGRGLPFGAVGPVVSLPQHRRKGHVGACLRRALEDMRERGISLSGLHTPHPTLYQRYGWEIASEKRVYTFPPKQTVLKAQPEQRGRTRMLKPDDWSQADRVYRTHSAQRNMPLHRGEVWWKEAIFGASFPLPADVALWENDAGEAEGYVVYYQPTTNNGEQDMPPFWIRELTALSTDAYLNLINYILRHDLPSKISWYAPVDDPFHSLVDDARQLTITHEYDLMVRIVDVEAALRMRAPANGGQSLALTLKLSDSSAPWNEGVWRVESADGAVNVEKAGGEPDLTLSTTTLAPIYNGFVSPTAAALAGRVEARNEDVLATADALFATLHPPYCADGF